jgi:hypothetical protein
LKDPEYDGDYYLSRKHWLSHDAFNLACIAGKDGLVSYMLAEIKRMT